MEALTQEMMNRLFEVTDEAGVDREAVSVPLELSAEGGVSRTASGRFEITLPATDLDAFLASLPERLRGLGAGETD